MNLRLLLLLFIIYISPSLFAVGGVMTGAGTDLSPYLIEDYEDLKKVGTTATYTKAKVYRLKNNIDATLSATEDTGKGFKPIGTLASPFTGKFRGNGKIISNLYINRVAEINVGLIGYMNTGALLDSIRMQNSFIKGSASVGGLVGTCKNSSVIAAHNSDSVIAIGNFAGGIAGVAESATISNCSNSGNIKSVENAGGIVGNALVTIALSNCYNKGNIYASSKYSAGIAGKTVLGTITNCTNYASINGLDYVGGIIGQSTSVVTNCRNVAAVTGDKYVGGLIGYTQTVNSLIKTSFNTGKCYGASFVGGLIGYASAGTTRSSYSTGDVHGTVSSTGGFIGQTFNSSQDSCYSTGLLSGLTNVGAFVGSNFGGVFTACYFNSETAGLTKDIGSDLSDIDPIPDLVVAEMKDPAHISGLDYSQYWFIRTDSIYPALNTLNNAPFAMPDTIRVGARALIDGVPFSALLQNDYDPETLQDSLAFKFNTISNGTTDSLTLINFPTSPLNGHSIQLRYRIGEKNALQPDTLWGNTAKAVVILDDTAPVFTQTTYATNEDSITVFKLQVNDAEADTIIFSIQTTALHATIELKHDTLIYTPEADYFGLDSIQILLSDGFLQQARWVKINVTPVNDKPLVNEITLTQVAGVEMRVKMPISDVDDTSFMAHVSTLPLHGVVTSIKDSLIYTSNPLFVGNDTLTWFATDTAGLASDSVYLIITLTAPQLSVSSDSIHFRASAASDSVLVSSTSSWTASTAETWITVQPVSQFGNDSLSISVQENLSALPRSGTITISTPGAVSQIIKIQQDGKIQLDYYGYLLYSYKIYDGSDTARFTQGNLVNVQSQDVGKVNCSLQAHYDNASVGTAKMIVVSFSISGQESTNYLSPINDTIYTATIAAKQLTITNPSIQTKKIVDGNSTAQILGLGTLSGVIASDEESVAIAATANYATASVGAKTIVVNYSISGSKASNYIQPTTYSVLGEIFSNQIIATVGADSLASCNASSIELPYVIYDGKPIEYRIVYDANAITAGFSNIAYTAMLSTSLADVLPIIIPPIVNFGKYAAHIQFRNELGVESALYPFSFYVNVPASSIVLQLPTVLKLNDSQHQFTAYQWYKDGEAITNANSDFYTNMNGFAGNYYLRLTTTSGSYFYTCEKYFDSYVPPSQAVRIYPNPMHANESCTLELSDTLLPQSNAKLNIFDTEGKLVYSSIINTASTQFNFTTSAGLYILHLVLDNGKEYSFEVLVKE